MATAVVAVSLTLEPGGGAAIPLSRDQLRDRLEPEHLTLLNFQPTVATGI